MATYRTTDEVFDAFARGDITAEMAKAECSSLAKPAGGPDQPVRWKIGPKGTLCAYLGRMPTALYYEQWLRLVAALPMGIALAEKHLGVPFRGESGKEGEKKVPYSVCTALKRSVAEVEVLRSAAIASLAPAN